MKQKKHAFKSKVLFIFTLVFMLSCVMMTSSWAAKKVDFTNSNAKGYIEKLNQGILEPGRMGPIFGLGQDEEFKNVRHTKDFNGVIHYRYQQMYKGFPIWGTEVVISKDYMDAVVRLHGSIVQETSKDITSIPGTLDPKTALSNMEKKQMEKRHGRHLEL